jgi:hypothetical protein
LICVLQLVSNFYAELDHARARKPAANEVASVRICASKNNETRTCGQTVAPETFGGQSCDPAEIEPLDDVVAFQFVDRIGRDDDFTMDDDVTAIRDPDRLIEVLFCHEHG